VNYTGTGYLDDLVVTTVDPFDGDPGIETFLLSVTGSGSGSSSLGSLPYVQVAMDSGSSTQVVYTAADWYRIAVLTANGAPINAAVGQRCYTQQIASISGNISNAVTFAEATQSQAGHGDVPLSWLKQWREDAVRNQGDGFDVATKYLLGLDPTSYNTFALTIADLKIDGNKVITMVKRNVTGDLSPDGMAGYLKLQIAEQLGDTFETIVDTPITGATVFDANDCHTYTNTLDITTRFIRAVIE
jgi:hypothetical protein